MLPQPLADGSEIPFPDVLVAHHRTRATGILHCGARDARCLVRLEQGLPRWAEPDETCPLSGDRIVEETQRARALDLLLELFNWNGGDYWLDPLVFPSRGPRALDLTIEEVVGRGTSRVTRLDLLRRHAGGPEDHLVVPVTFPLELLHTLSDATCGVLGAIRAGGVTSEARDGLPDDLRVLQCIWELRLLGLARTVERGGVPDPRPPAGPGGALRATSRPSPASGPDPVGARAADRPEVGGAAPQSRRCAARGAAARHDFQRRAPERRSHRTPLSAAPAGRRDRAASARSRVTAVAWTPEPDARAPQSAASNWFASGRRFLRERDWHSAVVCFAEAVRLRPDDGEALYHLGLAQTRNPRWRKSAEESLLRAESLLPCDLRVQIALGLLYGSAGLERRSEERFRAVLASDPSNAEALDGLVALRQGGATGDLEAARRSAARELQRTAGTGRDDDEALAGD